MQIKQNYKFNILYNKGIASLPYPYRNSIHLAQALAALFRAGFVWLRPAGTRVAH